MLSDTIKVCESVKRSSRITAPPPRMPLGLRNSAHVVSDHMKKKIQIQSGSTSTSCRVCRGPLDDSCPVHEKAKHTARQCRILKKLPSTSSFRGTLGILVVAPTDGCLAIAPHLASTQDLLSRHVSSALKYLAGSRLRPLSLWPWFCGSNKESDGFLVNHHKPRKLGAASTAIPLMTWPPRCPDLTLVLRLNQ
jgi:hypothetical protein